MHNLFHRHKVSCRYNIYKTSPGAVFSSPGAFSFPRVLFFLHRCFFFSQDAFSSPGHSWVLFSRRFLVGPVNNSHRKIDCSFFLRSIFNEKGFIHEIGFILNTVVKAFCYFFSGPKKNSGTIIGKHIEIIQNYCFNGFVSDV